MTWQLFKNDREDRVGTRGRRLVLLAAGLAWLAVALPLALGLETLYFRDVFNHFLPFKSFGVSELLQGRIPAINPTVGLGQPYRGDPGNLAFYPGNVLFLVLPFWSALNLHYLLHWLLSFFTFRAFARRLGLGGAAAALAGLAWAGGGWMLSNLSFHNLIVVAAWWPLALAGAVTGGRRGVATGGLACGMALLGGEPVTATLGLVPLVWLAVSHRGLRRGLLATLGIGAVGLLIALPQVVAMARVMGFSERVVAGLAPGAGYSLHPARLLELVIPTPFGTPEGLGVDRFWAHRIVPRPPFVLSLHFGIVALSLAVLGLRRRPAWAALAGLGLLLAGLGRLVPDAVFELTGGLFRFPEKFLLWMALFAPLLAGAGLEKVLAERKMARRLVIVAAAGVVAALVLPISGAGSGLVQWLAPGLPSSGASHLIAVWVPRWTVALGLAGLFLAGTAAAVHRRSAPGLLLLQLLCLLPLLWLIPRDSTAPYREPAPWSGDLAPGSEVVTMTHNALFPATRPPYRLPLDSTRATLRRLRHLDLDFPTGVGQGLSYPLGPDAVGLHSPLMYVLYHHIGLLEDPGQERWLRVLGAQRVVRWDAPQAPGWIPLDRAERLGVPTYLAAVERPAPRVWWPREVTPVDHPLEAFQRVAETEDPVARVTVMTGSPHHPEARVELVEETPDRLVVEVDGEGGILVLRRSFHPIYRATAEDRRLRTLPVNVALLGVEVPAGSQRVVVEVTEWPETLAAILALLTALGCLWGLVSRPISRPMVPSRP